MSKPSPQLHDLHQPEKLSKILNEDKDDCLSCRLVGQFNLSPFSILSNEHLTNPYIHESGASAFGGLGAYVYFSGQRALRERGHIIAKQMGAGSLKWRLRGIALLSSSFVGMGLYRLVN